jgi:hypothetical protein
MWLTLILLSRVLLQGNVINSSPVPRFEQYRVAKIYRGKPAVPILRTAEDREYRTRIRRGAKDGPNFAGHYTVIMVGCGTECASFLIVDAETGRIFARAQKKYTCEPTFKLDSRLMETDSCDCSRLFWEWTGTELKLITKAPADCPPWIKK